MAENGEVEPMAPLSNDPSEPIRTMKRSEPMAGRNGFEEPASKRVKLDLDRADITEGTATKPERQKGVTPIKAEYLIDLSRTAEPTAQADDDAAESAGKPEYKQAQGQASAGRGGQKTKGGQNHTRQFGSSRDAIQLCMSRARVNEFAPPSCSFGAKCKFEHDLRKYLQDGKRGDLETFEGMCPILEVKGKCTAGWRCRFAGSHSKEVQHEDGRKELMLVKKNGETVDGDAGAEEGEEGIAVANVVSVGDKIQLRKKKFPTSKSEQYLKWLDQRMNNGGNSKAEDGNDEATNGVHENRARYREPPLKPSEKRRIYYGPETPILAPLTTQGNMPFRRLCVSLGAQVTWSEMAMSLPLLQGEKQEWALMKAHESETLPPKYTPKAIVQDYDNTKDLKFGAQIAANKPWLALKTTEVLTSLAPSLRAIDLNCGCPIDLVYRQGSGSALLDAPAKLEKILRGMNTVSGEVPITVKIRMGTKDKHPTAEKLSRRLVLGGEEAQDAGEGPAGVAAITLHGRSRQQRYTRSADWEYIADCASLVQKLKTQKAQVTDTVREPDARDLSSSVNSAGLPYFIGNGDILSHTDYNDHMSTGKLDSCMIARGALIKPWIFEEIESQQYLDKSASERLGYIERFVRNGLEYWGSDEVGVGTTRRFLLEWLSFSCRYVPIGILEVLPPRFGDRPPAFRGRSELETLLSSGNYKDWIKISEMFLGPAHKDFNFQPKHKSNSYEIEAEG
ncbi:tRNA-dihydrouridine synthase 3 [Vermiconidia calcicola]|uniref:tRNA-dihydrouridine synthase 3 n=1 Tax=Vermiconidia calcicola TaxID=1690605 RepID=A0ACC3NVY7_9PEZI|nr:tRNA-dihydrouridine synthase 3 [Vermiconidia calcicola]